jgi:hypothetical protein
MGISNPENWNITTTAVRSPATVTTYIYHHSNRQKSSIPGLFTYFIAVATEPIDEVAGKISAIGEGQHT